MKWPGLRVILPVKKAERKYISFHHCSSIEDRAQYCSALVGNLKNVSWKADKVGEFFFFFASIYFTRMAR